MAIDALNVAQSNAAMPIRENSSGGVGWRDRHIHCAKSASAGTTETARRVTSLAGGGPGGPST